MLYTLVTTCALNQYVASNSCMDCAAGSTRGEGDLATGSDTFCEGTVAALCLVPDFSVMFVMLSRPRVQPLRAWSINMSPVTVAWIVLLALRVLGEILPQALIPSAKVPLAVCLVQFFVVS